MRAWLLVLAACGSKATPPAQGSGSAPVAPIEVITPIDAAVVELDASVAPIDAAPVAGPPAPTKPADLQAWLVAGHYKAWHHESKRHESAGPHPVEVQTYVSPSLHATLATGGPHAVGAAAVKELYNGDGKHTGWAVSVKVDADSKEGRGWYWYEVFATTEKAKPAYDGKGKQLCRDCHTEGGIDQVLIPFPLQ